MCCQHLIANFHNPNQELIGILERWICLMLGWLSHEWGSTSVCPFLPPPTTRNRLKDLLYYKAPIRTSCFSFFHLFFSFSCLWFYFGLPSISYWVVQKNRLVESVTAFLLSPYCQWFSHCSHFLRVYFLVSFIPTSIPLLYFKYFLHSLIVSQTLTNFLSLTNF